MACAEQKGSRVRAVAARCPSVAPSQNPIHPSSMNSDIKTTIATLNDLIEVLRDGQHGFKTAAEDAEASELAQLFNRYSRQRAEFVTELQTRVRSLGADVEASGSVAGSMHRGWINLKSALSTNEPHAVLAEAERGEDAAVDAFKKALENEDLDLASRDIITRQYNEIQAAHDKVRELRDGMTYRKAS